MQYPNLLQLFGHNFLVSVLQNSEIDAGQVNDPYAVVLFEVNF